MYVGTERISFLEKDFIMSKSYMVWQLVEELNSGIHHTFLKRSALHYHTCRFFLVYCNYKCDIYLQWFCAIDVTKSKVSFLCWSNTLERDVTADRKMTSRHYSPRRIPLPSLTADPNPEALLTRSEFPTLSRQFIATIGTSEATRFFNVNIQLELCVI